MSIVLRRTGRTITISLSAVALALGASACSGGGSEQEKEDGQQQEQPAADPAEETDQQPSDGGGSDAGGAEAPAATDGGGDVTDEDLTAAADRVVEFLQTLDDSEWEKACSLALDPTTGKPAEGDALTQCAEGMRSGYESSGVTFSPGMFDVVDASMLEKEDNGDGTVTVGLEEQKFVLVKLDDGQWYVDPTGTQASGGNAAGE